MLIKKRFLLVFVIILINCIENECQTVECYSCSDCANASLTSLNTIKTTNDTDKCIKTIITTEGNLGNQKLINRGASSTCTPYSSEQISIFCCHLDLCNA